MGFPRLIFHVDVNSAFLSWSSVKILSENPSAQDLREVPSAVCGDVESRHGIILAKSIPSKKYGVTTGEPVGAALRKCPGLILVKPDFSFYRRCSDALMKMLGEYSPALEQLSIDEAFADMTGIAMSEEEAVRKAYAVKDRVREELGFTVNVGVADNKLLAKMASDFEKPDKVHTLFSREVPQKMWPLPVGDLYGIGKSSQAALRSMGIETIGDLASCPEEKLIARFGSKTGTRLGRAARGEDDSPVKTEEDERKSYGNSITLSKDLTEDTRDELDPILLALADSVACRMRADGVRASQLTVQLRTAGFKDRSRQGPLSKPTDVTDEIYAAAKELFMRLWDGKTPVRLIGVSASKLTTEEGSQMTLFDSASVEDEESQKSRKLDEVTDSIRKKFGRSSLMRGSVLGSADAGNVGRKE